MPELPADVLEEEKELIKRKAFLEQLGGHLLEFTINVEAIEDFEDEEMVIEDKNGS